MRRSAGLPHQCSRQPPGPSIHISSHSRPSRPSQGSRPPRKAPQRCRPGTGLARNISLSTASGQAASPARPSSRYPAIFHDHHPNPHNQHSSSRCSMMRNVVPSSALIFFARLQKIPRTPSGSSWEVRLVQHQQNPAAWPSPPPDLKAASDRPTAPPHFFQTRSGSTKKAGHLCYPQSDGTGLIAQIFRPKASSMPDLIRSQADCRDFWQP